MKRSWILVACCGVMVVSSLVSYMQRSRFEKECVTSGGTVVMRQKESEPTCNAARAFGNAIADAVEKAMPSVVVVRTEAMHVKFKKDIFGFIYRVPEQLAGEGSGVIVDSRGYIITSWHVIDGAQQIDVVLTDGRKLPAVCVGYDRAVDLAVLQIRNEGDTDFEEGSFAAVEFGNSNTLRVGELVIAIGSPFSLQSSVTVGHVSQKGRRVQVLPYEDFIQTDAAINEGNSGGPLIDVDGRLIGINTAKKTDAQANSIGIAFAIPSNLAMVIAQSIIENGRHEWPWVGAFFGGDKVHVQKVWDDSPAALAGVLPGDVVLSVNDMPVANEHDVYRIIYSHPVGTPLAFKFKRKEEKPFEVKMVLEQFPGVTP